MPPVFLTAGGVSVGLIIGAFFLAGGHHEIAWRLRQRRRRRVPIEYGGRRL